MQIRNLCRGKFSYLPSLSKRRRRLVCWLLAEQLLPALQEEANRNDPQEMRILERWKKWLSETNGVYSRVGDSELSRCSGHLSALLDQVPDGPAPTLLFLSILLGMLCDVVEEAAVGHRRGWSYLLQAVEEYAQLEEYHGDTANPLRASALLTSGRWEVPEDMGPRIPRRFREIYLPPAA